MRLAHLADLHVGFRSLNRTGPGGQNAREADVAIALRRVVDDLLEVRPDVVVIAGDVFHSVRPTNNAILTLFTQLQRLRVGLPDTRVVIVAGNHDTPRTSETQFILPLYQALGADVALIEPLVVRLPECTITAVPSDAAARIPDPDPAAPRNVLVLHAGVAGFCGPAPDAGADPDALQRAGWDYVALGDYHVAAQVGSRAWYSGAIEYTSSDPWGELKAEAVRKLPGKGYLLVELGTEGVGGYDGPPGNGRHGVDLQRGARPLPQVTFRPIGPTRRYVDLESIDATGLGAAELDRAIADRVDAIDVTDAIVRLRVLNVTREMRRELDYERIRLWKAAAFHFQIEFHRPEELHTPAARVARYKKIDELVGAYLGERTLPPDVDRQAFVDLGLAYLQEAAAAGDPYTGEPVGRREKDAA